MSFSSLEWTIIQDTSSNSAFLDQRVLLLLGWMFPCSLKAVVPVYFVASYNVFLCRCGMLVLKPSSLLRKMT